MRMRDTKWKKLGIARIDRLHFLLGRRRMFSCLESKVLQMNMFTIYMKFVYMQKRN